MTVYEKLLDKAEQLNVNIIEKTFKSNAKGLCKGNRIAINKNTDTEIEKSCILAEELGHYITSVGDILDQTDVNNRKQEMRARLWAYDTRIGLIGIVRAFEYGCSSIFEMAEYLNVTENFLLDAIHAYKAKYGLAVCIDAYIIYFEPCLSVMKLF